MIKIAWHYFIK